MEFLAISEWMRSIITPNTNVGVVDIAFVAARHVNDFTDGCNEKTNKL
jgi:hypothetical protein